MLEDNTTFLSKERHTLTYMSIVIEQVVGELESVERYSLLHPLGSTGG